MKYKRQFTTDARRIITYANETNKPIALITVDQLKGLRPCLTYLSLQDFRKIWIWTQLPTMAQKRSVKGNGQLTVFIPIERGLPQGCALSMPLYVLTTGLLATYLREVRAPQSYVHCFRTLQWLTSGGNFIRPQGPLVGPAQMVLWPPVLIFSVFPWHEFT